MTKSIIMVSVFLLGLVFCSSARTYAAAPDTQSAAEADAATKESGLKSWWNKWRGKSEEKAVQVLENRGKIAEKAKDKGVKIKSAAEKMAAQAEKQRGKGNDNSAAKLQDNAERLDGLGDILRDTSEKAKDKGGDVLKQLNKQIGKKK